MTPAKYPIFMFRDFHRWIGFLLVQLCLCGAVQGQEADAEEEEEIIVMDVFEVDSSQDIGYLSTNAISGSRLNTQIRDLPMNLEVINADFISDTGATDLRESLEFSAGITLDTFETGGASGRGANAFDSGETSPSSAGNVNDDRTNAIQIRGFTVPFQQRDGFRIGTTISAFEVTLGSLTDSVNVERNEVLRGPVALLYGVGVLSGIVNVIPKRPPATHQTEVSTAFGSDNFLRVTFDHGGPILDQHETWGDLLYRVATVYQEEEEWWDHRQDYKEYFVGQLEWTPDPVITVFTEYQLGKTRFEGFGDREIFDNLGNANNPTFRTEYREQFSWLRELSPQLGGPEYGYEANATGADPYYERDEWTLLYDVVIRPTRDLTFKLGAFFAYQETEQFDVRTQLFNNRDGNYQIYVEQDLSDFGLGTVPGVDFADFGQPELTSADIFFLDNGPEFAPDTGFPPTTSGLDATQEDQRIRRDDIAADDEKMLRYWWTKLPQEAFSAQYRAEVNYQFRTPIPLPGFRTLNHSVLLGLSYNRDEIDFPDEDEPAGSAQSTGVTGQPDRDPYQLRSFFDFTPITYNGEALARPGRNYVSAEVEFEGAYFVYQGKALDDRLQIIGGLRHDRYDLQVEYWDRGQPNPLSSENVQLGINEVRSERESLDEPEEFTTGTIGLSYRLTEFMNIYGVRAQGIVPNTGQTDGFGEPIEAEQSLGTEVGVKFDLFDRRISGTVSFYKIERENATWNYNNGPNPAEWLGGANQGASTGNFNPTEIVEADRQGTSLDARDGTQTISYGIHWSYLELTPAQLGSWDPTASDVVILPGNIPVNNTPPDLDGIVAIRYTTESVDPTDPLEWYAFIDYNQIDEAGWRDAMERAFADWSVPAEDRRVPEGNNPMIYRTVDGGALGRNPSNGQGSTVTFEDESTGIDIELIFTILPNWQIKAGYSRIEREATANFQLVDARDTVSGRSFGTEYDIWVRDLGRAAFGDPTDPSTSAEGGEGGIIGQSLYTGAEDTVTLWTKYTLEEGPLKGFSFGGGAKWEGPKRTAIPIGGNSLEQNRFGTPDTEEFFRLDLFFQYKKSFEHFDLSLQLNVFNVLDDDELQTEVVFDRPDSLGFDRRRTDVRLPPRSWRITSRLSF